MDDDNDDAIRTMLPMLLDFLIWRVMFLLDAVATWNGGAATLRYFLHIQRDKAQSCS